MGLSERVTNEVGRLLNGTNNPDCAAIAHLATAAARAAESLIYLAEIDDSRFDGVWPNDGRDNDAIDDGHVRWAASSALTSLDLCIAAAGRLAGFAKRPPKYEDSIRDFYAVTTSGKIVDERHRVKPPPWRLWIDEVVADARYVTLLSVRNTLVHADAFRVMHGTTGPVQGHSMRYGYNVGPLIPPAHTSTHFPIRAREIVELSRDVSLTHVGAFVDVLQSL